MRAFAEDFGISIPEMNDPHETPFHARPDVLVGGDIIPVEDAAYQTILAREEGGHTRHPLGVLQGEGPSTSAAMTWARRRVGEGISLSPFKQRLWGHAQSAVGCVSRNQAAARGAVSLGVVRCGSRHKTMEARPSWSSTTLSPCP